MTSKAYEQAKAKVAEVQARKQAEQAKAESEQRRRETTKGWTKK